MNFQEFFPVLPSRQRLPIFCRLAILLLAALSEKAAAQGPMINGWMHVGTIAPAGDSDTWTVDANDGDTIVVRVHKLSTNTLFAPRLELYDPGNVILAISTTTLGAEVRVRAKSAGTHTVVVKDQSGTQTDNYRLTLAKSPGVVFVAPGDEGGAMNGTGVYNGTLERGDLDVWTFSACQGEIISLRMDELVVGSTLTPQLRLYGRAGLLSWVSGPATTQIELLAPATGNYLVIAGAESTGGASSSGDYSLTVNNLFGGLKLCLPTISGTNLNLTGIGSTANAQFVLFTQTNVAAPAALWSPILTNQFDQYGAFNQTNVSGRNEPQRYFHLLQQ